MDSTGISELSTLKDEHINLLFIGDQHTAYDVYKQNILHQWINLKVTKGDWSYSIFFL